jgi:hypothetical protein
MQLAMLVYASKCSFFLIFKLKTQGSLQQLAMLAYATWAGFFLISAPGHKIKNAMLAYATWAS